MDLPSHIQKPKLCSLRKWENFAGYGFNLHSEKGRQGQFIGKVDPNSPADLGGLNSHDVLIEVNGINVEDASHNIVVGRVKSIPDRVDLFVCHLDTYQYCKENDIKLSSAMHNISEHSTPVRQPEPEERKSKQSPPPQPSDDNAAAEAAAAASLRAAIDASGGVDFEEVNPSELPERFRSDEPEDTTIQQRTPDQSTKRSTSPPPSFTATAAATAAAPAQPVAPAAAAAAPVVANAASASAPPAYTAPQQPQQKAPSSRDPVGNVSLDEVRSRIGQNKRNQVKMSSNTFSEKYSMFEAL